MSKLVFYLLMSSFVFSQRIEVDVTITAERLTTFQKDEIRYLEEAVENYINNFEWNSSENDDVIKCKYSFIIESVTDNGGNNEYKAQLLMSSPAQENYYDKNATFRYSSTEELRHYSAEYQSLSNLLDFYTSMILAGELDTYQEFGGDELYGKAREALVKGKSSAFSTQWSYREKIFLDSTSPFARSLRLAKLNYYTALSEKEEVIIMKHERLLLKLYRI